MPIRVKSDPRPYTPYRNAWIGDGHFELDPKSESGFFKYYCGPWKIAL